MALDPNKVAQKWLNATANAGQAYKDGVNAVQEAPTARAAAQQQLYVQRVQESVNSGRYASRLQAVSLQDWKNAAINTGAPRLASGAAKGQQKFAAFAQKFAPVWQSIRDQVRGMPKGGRAEAMARVMAAADAMKQAAGKNW